MDAAMTNVDVEIQHPGPCSTICSCATDDQLPLFRSAKADLVQQYQREVAEADVFLIGIRNADVDPGEILAAETTRHAAQERLDAAYQQLVSACSKMPDKIRDVDDDDAELTDSDGEQDDEDDEDGGAAGNGSFDSQATGAGTRAMLRSPPASDDEDEDEEYQP